MSTWQELFSTSHGYTDLAAQGEPVSPLDGRYRPAAAPLANFLSEAGLNRARVHVEVEWFIHLLDQALLPGAPRLTDAERDYLRALPAPVSTLRLSGSFTCSIRRSFRAPHA